MSYMLGHNNHVDLLHITLHVCIKIIKLGDYFIKTHSQCFQ